MLHEILNAFQAFKCGEVLCMGDAEYKVNCCFCREKLVFEAFPAHFRNKHSERRGYAEYNDQSQKPEEKDPFELCNIVVKNEAQDYGYNEHNDEALKNVTIDIESDVKIEQDFDEVSLNQTVASCRTSNPKITKTESINCHKWQREELNFKTQHADELLIPMESLDRANVLDVQQLPANQTDDSRGHVYNDADNNKNNINEISSALLKSYKCSRCSKSVLGKRALFAHIKEHHGQLPRAKRYRGFKCDFKDCTLGFSDEKLLQNHKIKHANSTCDICGKNFSTFSYLAKHKMRHGNERKVCCSLCDYKTFTEMELKSHMITHTGILPHICEICGKKCRHKGELKQHMLRHTGKRPCKCKVCDKSFFCTTDLKRHMSVHSEERPFVCNCGVRAKTKRKLRVHQKIHETQRNFECQLCDRKFAKEKGLKYHIVVFHDAAVLKSVTVNNTNKWRKKKEVSAVSIGDSNLIQTS